MNGILPTLALYAACAAGVAAIVAAARGSRLALAGTTCAFAAAIAALQMRVSAPDVWFEDFISAYWPAAHAVLQGPDALRAEFAKGVFGYVNLPIVAYLFAPLGALAPKPAALVFFGIGIGAVLAAWRLMRVLFSLSDRDSALLLLGLSAYGPLAYSLKEGNTSHIVLAALLGGLLAIRTRRDLLGGALLALAAILKPALLLLGFLYALRGRWRVALAGAGVCAAVAGASLLVFGWDTHRLWYDAVIAPYAGRPVPAFNAQSFAAAFTRQETGLPGLLLWEPVEVSALGKGAATGAALVLLALGAAAALAARRRGGADTLEIEALMVIAFVCAASTLSWSHYYVWLVPAFVTALRASSAWTRRLAAGALIIALPGEFLSPAMRDGAYGPLTNVLTSHLLLAGVATFLALARLRYGGGSRDADAKPFAPGAAGAAASKLETK